MFRSVGFHIKYVSVIIVFIQLHVYNTYLLLFDRERSNDFYKGALDWQNNKLPVLLEESSRRRFARYVHVKNWNLFFYCSNIAKSENAMLWRMLSRLETCIVYCCIWTVTQFVDLSRLQFTSDESEFITDYIYTLTMKKYWKFNLHLYQEQLRNVRVSQFSSCFSWDDW
jgi:hypothetical protein